MIFNDHIVLVVHIVSKPIILICFNIDNIPVPVVIHMLLTIGVYSELSLVIFVIGMCVCVPNYVLFVIYDLYLSVLNFFFYQFNKLYHSYHYY